MSPPTRRRREDAVHPRPQLSRPEWWELDGAWGFAADADDIGLRDGWATDPAPFVERITVPFPPESPASGLAEPRAETVVWYRRELTLPERRSRRWILHFGAVDHHAMVWVDGALVAEHVGGHTPFSADVTGALASGGEHVVVVRAEDANDLEQPRGKQHWGEVPEEVWYDRTTGIWQPVWLEAVPFLHIERVRWTPDIENLRLRLEVELSVRPPAPLHLEVRLTGPRGAQVDDTYLVTQRTLHREIGIDIGAPSIARRRDILWSPEHPNLLDVRLALREGDTVIDEVESYVGLRSAGVRDGAFRLNGWPYYLRLVLDQGYWPESHLAAPDADALRRDVELIKELGFNGIRLHQKVEDPRFLYWCDRLGLLVWSEMPSSYRFSPRSVEMLAREWLELLRRDHSHPCVVTWVAFNESWGVEWLRDRPEQRAAIAGLRELAHAVDGTRPVVGNDGWEVEGGEIVGIHDYIRDPEVIRSRYGSRLIIDETLRRVQPNGHPILLPGLETGHAAVVLSEFGGISVKPAEHDEWFSYDVVNDSQTLLERWRELFGAVLDSDALAGFCYTQFCDTRQERNGMVTAERRPRVDPASIREIIQQPPRAIPGEALLGQIQTAEREVDTGAGG